VGPLCRIYPLPPSVSFQQIVKSRGYIGVASRSSHGRPRILAGSVSAPLGRWPRTPLASRVFGHAPTALAVWWTQARPALAAPRRTPVGTTNHCGFRAEPKPFSCATATEFRVLLQGINWCVPASLTSSVPGTGAVTAILVCSSTKRRRDPPHHCNSPVAMWELR
jgi:hypothetical protein